jgi:hypothetical protein
MSWMWFASLVVAAAVGMLLGVLVMAFLIAGNPASNPLSNTSFRGPGAGNNVDPDPMDKRSKRQGEDGQIGT